MNLPSSILYPSNPSSVAGLDSDDAVTLRSPRLPGVRLVTTTCPGLCPRRRRHHWESISSNGINFRTCEGSAKDASDRYPLSHSTSYLLHTAVSGYQSIYIIIIILLLNGSFHFHTFSMMFISTPPSVNEPPLRSTV